jgi:hypothetical protein
MKPGIVGCMMGTTVSLAFISSPTCRETPCSSSGWGIRKTLPAIGADTV